MIIIGEKLNGSIPSVAKAIAERDADLIRERAKMQAEAGADFLDVCASVEEEVEVETLKWMIDIVQEVTDTRICVDSPSAKTCAEGIKLCKRPGLVNSVSLEGNKIDTIFPVIADTDWECVALLCDNDGLLREGGLPQRLHPGGARGLHRPGPGLRPGRAGGAVPPAGGGIPHRALPAGRRPGQRRPGHGGGPGALRHPRAHAHPCSHHATTIPNRMRGNCYAHLL